MRSSSKVRRARPVRSRAARFRVEFLEPRIALAGTAPDWTSIGPAPITDSFHRNVDAKYVSPPEITGAVQAIATYTYKGKDGTLETGAYVGVPLGGVWETPDILAANRTWTTITDPKAPLAISTLGVSPVDQSGKTVFAGTGPTPNGGLGLPDSALETGVYLSNNGGQSWIPLTGKKSPVYGKFITKVLPANDGPIVADETLLVGTDDGLYVFTEGATELQKQTFTNPVLDIIEDPLKNGVFYLLAGADKKGQGAGVYMSKDPAGKWTPINGGTLDGSVLSLFPKFDKKGNFEGAGRLAVTTTGTGKDEQTLLYMTFQKNTDKDTYGVFYIQGPSGKNTNWSTLYTLPDKAKTGGDHNFAFAVDPSSPWVVYVGGYGGNQVFRIDGTSSLTSPTVTPLTDEKANSLYDIRALTFATGGTKKQEQPVLILTSDSGVYSLANASTAGTLPTWTPVMNNVSVTESYAVSAMAGSAGQLYVGGGAQDTASYQSAISSSGQSSWVSLNSGDGNGTAYDPSAGLLYTSSDYVTDLQVYDPSTNNQEPVKFTGFAAKEGFPEKIAVSSVATNPNQPRAVVFAAVALYEAQPASLTSGTVAVKQILAPDTNNNKFSALALGGTYHATPDPNILYAARGNLLWYSDTFQGTPTVVKGWTHGEIVGLALDPNDDQVIYALTSDTLYESIDAGATWSPYGAQPDTTIGQFSKLGLVPVTVGGTPEDVLLAGGQFGAEELLFDNSQNLDVTSPVGANSPNGEVSDFSYVPSLDDLVMSTFGLGDWLLTDASKQLLYPIAGKSETKLTALTNAVAGQPASLAARVFALVQGKPAPTGTVAFSAVDGAGNTTALGSVTVGPGGEAQLFLPTGLPAGTATLEADYSGDSKYSSSNDQQTTTVALTSTDTALIAPPAAPATDSFTVTASVAAASGGVAPTGVITFYDNGQSLGAAALDGGVASLTVPRQAVGTHRLTASYAPDSGSPFQPSQTLSPTSLTVTPVTTNVALIAPASSPGATPVALTAIVSASSGVPVGAVTFYDGAQPLGSAPVNASGVATLTVPGFSVGTHALAASFKPTPGSPFTPSPDSAPWTLKALAPPAPVTFPSATTTILSATPIRRSRTNPRPAVAFGVQVTAGRAGVGSGLVELLAGGHAVAVGSVDASGGVTLTVPLRQVLNRPVTALFLGGSSSGGAAAPSQSASVTPTVRWFLHPFGSQ